MNKSLRTQKTAIATAVMMASMAFTLNASASSHREAIDTMNDPCIDNTDLYAWVEPATHDKLYLIANLVPLHQPGQGNQQTRFCDGIKYRFNISTGVTTLDSELFYEIEFARTTPPAPVPLASINGETPVGGGAEILIQLDGSKQTYTVKKFDLRKPKAEQMTVLGRNLPVALPNVGPRTDRIYGLGEIDGGFSTENLYDDAFAATFINNLVNQGRAFAGHRDDPFYLDEAGIFDVLNLRPQGVAQDVFAGSNLMSMALEVPITDIFPAGVPHQNVPGNDTLIAVHATVLREEGLKFDASISPAEKFRRASKYALAKEPVYTQVGRQGLPLVNAGLIGTQDQNKYLRTQPVNDFANFGAYFLYPTLVRDFNFLGGYAGVDPAAVKQLLGPRVDILQTINLDNYPFPGAHSVPLAPGFTGDVIRLDVALDSKFPNGRKLIPDLNEKPADMEDVDVSDVLISVIVGGAALLGDKAIAVSDGVQYNDKPYLREFPFLALPSDGVNRGTGKPTPVRSGDPE